MRRAQRGLTLVAVLVIMSSGILVATGLLFVAQSQIAGVSGAERRVQTHALAWSGVQAIMVRLDEQREEILSGNTPELDEQYDIYEAPSRTGVVRLLPLGPGDERVVPEAGKLDLQACDEAALVATGLVDEQVARDIVTHRESSGRPYQSVAELLTVDGVSPDMLYGPVEAIGEADAGAVAGEADEPTLRRTDAAPRGLADVLTVYGHEPALQQDGRLRINLNVPWSDELGRRVEERFDQEAAGTLRGILESGTTFETDAALFDVLNFFQLPPEEWPEIVDTFMTDDGEFHHGRLDINTAPYEALAALPGLEPEQAAGIVQMRDDLDDEDRATVAWPAIHGIIETTQYPDIAGRITTRSWTYRLRFAAGEVDPDDPEGPIENAVIYEAVIDLSSPRPRLGYFREVTWQRATALLAARLTTDELDDFDAPGEIEVPEEEPPPDESPDETPDEMDEMEDPEQPEADEEVPPSGDPPDSPPGPTGRRIGRWTGG